MSPPSWQSSVIPVVTRNQVQASLVLGKDRLPRKDQTLIQNSSARMTFPCSPCRRKDQTLPRSRSAGINRPPRPVFTSALLLIQTSLIILPRPSLQAHYATHHRHHI